MGDFRQNVTASIKDKLLRKILSGKQDTNVTFDEIMHLLRILKYNTRNTGGSHTVVSYNGTPEILNLQPQKDGKAKLYQIAQVRAHITKYNTHLKV